MSENPYDREFTKSRRIIANKLEGKEFDSVLEIGAQWGENLFALREKFPDKKLGVIDIDKETTEEAIKRTGLELRYGDAFEMDFKKDEFDVVCTHAFFCMIPPEKIEFLLKEIIRIAKKYIILIEFETVLRIGVISGGRTGANWVELFKDNGLKVTREKLKVTDVELPNPWISYGYIYMVEK